MTPDIQYCLDCSYELGELNAIEYYLFTNDLYHIDAAQTIIDSVDFRYGVKTIGYALNQYVIENLYSKGIQYIQSYVLNIFKDLDEYRESIISDAYMTNRMTIDFSNRDELDYNAVTLPISLRKSFYIERLLTRSEDKSDEVLDIEFSIDTIRTFVQDYLIQTPNITDIDQVVFNDNVRNRLRLNKHNVTEQRKVLKRSYLLADRLGMGEIVRQFLNGVVYVPSKTYDFVYKLQFYSLDTGSVGVSLVTKDKEHLARLCVYISNTPVIDVLISYYHLIRQGLDDLIVKKANWFQVSEQGKQFQTQLKIGPDPFEHMRPIWAEETV